MKTKDYIYYEYIGDILCRVDLREQAVYTRYGKILKQDLKQLLDSLQPRVFPALLGYNLETTFSGDFLDFTEEEETKPVNFDTVLKYGCVEFTVRDLEEVLCTLNITPPVSSKLVRIRLKTLEKNPDYGGKKYIPGGETTKWIFEVDGDDYSNIFKEYNEGLDYHITQQTIGPFKFKTKGEIYSSKMVEDILIHHYYPNFKILSIQKERERIDVTEYDCMSEYSYEYKDPKLKCTFCHSESKLSEYLRPEENVYTCPHCVKNHHVFVTYERVEDALRRKAMKNKEFTISLEDYKNMLNLYGGKL